MKSVAAILLAVALLVVVAWAFLYRERNVSAKDFKVFFLSHTEQTYSTWRLYKITGEDFCFEYSRPIVPERFCVLRSELDVKNSASGEPELGFVYARQLSLKGTGAGGEFEPLR